MSEDRGRCHRSWRLEVNCERRSPASSFPHNHVHEPASPDLKPGPSNCISAHWARLSFWQSDNTSLLYGACVYILRSWKRQPNKLLWLFYQGKLFLSSWLMHSSIHLAMSIYLVLSEYRPWCWDLGLPPELRLSYAHLALGVCWCVHVESCAMVF